MNIELNPNLDRNQLREELIRTGKIRVLDLLTNESAEAIREGLESNKQWNLVYSDEKANPVQLTVADLQSMNDSDLQKITEQLHASAPNKYQYIYKYFPIIDAITAGTLSPDSILYNIATFFNGTEFMRFAREITGANDLVKIDTKATLYEPGHFLNTHNDQDANDLGNGVRRYAVVVGMTKKWSPNWGGHTNFYANASDSAFESWNPGFNTMSIFKVPTLHSVSYVVPYAPKGRYSITGWLRSDSSIARPDLN